MGSGLRRLGLAAILIGGAVQAEPVTYSFVWEGQGGYWMRGALAYDSDSVSGAYVRETDLSCFVIEGFQEDVSVGRWALTMLLPETTWVLHFHPQTESFPVDGDEHGIVMPQAWNMDGFGRNCGVGGFGFNAGNFAQDLCVDQTLIEASQQPPQKRFGALRGDVDFPGDACRVPPLLGKSLNGIAPHRVFAQIAH